jgi:hypothetical protein
MKQFSLSANPPPTALVIVFPVGVKGLFNPAVHTLVREVQERLESVYVTYALSSGAPSVADAIAASRFAGCEAAVIVHAEDADVSGLGPLARLGDYSIEGSLELVSMTPAAVIGAYHTAVAAAGQAA